MSEDERLVPAKVFFRKYQGQLPFDYATFLEALKNMDLPNRKIGGRFYVSFKELKDVLLLEVVE